MTVVVVSVHIVVCVLLIMVVLLQAGKGAGMGSTLGGSSHSLLDGGSVNGILSKATTIAAVIFMFTSLTMGYINGKKHDSIMESGRAVVNQIDLSDDFPLAETNATNKHLFEIDSNILSESNDSVVDNNKFSVSADTIK